MNGLSAPEIAAIGEGMIVITVFVRMFPSVMIIVNFMDDAPLVQEGMRGENRPHCQQAKRHDVPHRSHALNCGGFPT